MIKKLLIVDDHEPTRRWLESFFSTLAGEIHQASDGQEALKICESQRPDWVVMDVAMKPMDGLTATRLITDRFPESRIVVITSHQEPKLGPEALRAGAVHFLLKEDLWQVRQFIESKSQPFNP